MATALEVKRARISELQGKLDKLKKAGSGSNPAGSGILDRIGGFLSQADAYKDKCTQTGSVVLIVGARLTA